MELTWKNAEAWETLANEGKDEYNQPTWRWDVNFKLDFDGPLLHISSRFYPPHKNDHDGWEGTVYVMQGENTLEEKAFLAADLDSLKKDVEEYVKSVSSRITLRSALPDNT